MSHLIEDDGIDDFSEKDDRDADENFSPALTPYVRKRKPKKILTDCHFCGKKFFKGRDDYDKMLKNYPKCKTCRLSGVNRKNVLLEKKCTVCKEYFVITSHMRKLESNGKAKWKVRCTNCKKVQRAPRGPLPKPGRDYFECDICGKSFHSRHLIYQHMDNHRKFDDLECNVCHRKSKNRSVLRTHLKTHFDQYICHLCGFIAKTSYTLRNHMSAHEADPNQVLDFSNVEPKSRFDKKPPEKGDFACRYCNYRFNTESAMNSHELRRHIANVAVQDLKCKVCGEFFHHTNDLRVHNFTHSTRPLLFCDYPGCNQFFNRIKPLNAHKKNVHKAQGVSCEICNKKFKMRGSLQKHLKNNRCIPVQVRKVQSGKTVLLGIAKPNNKTVDQLQEEAKIAKEQFRALGGVLKDNPSRAKKKKKIPKKVEQPFSDFDDDSYSDTESSIKNESDVKIKIESDDEENIQKSPIKFKDDPDEPVPMMKIEIKMEPQEDEEDQDNFIFQDHSIFVYDNYDQKNSQEDSLDDSLNPSVVLEKLDYETLLKWQQPKKEKFNYESPERSSRVPRIYQDKYMVQYKKKKELLDFTCDECGLSFDKKCLLKEHVYGHTHKYGKGYFCDICGEDFFFGRSLQHHKMEVHGKRKEKVFKEKIIALRQDHPFICDMCGNTYNSYQSITGHLKIVHKKFADFCCHICPAKFKTRMYLERHVEDVHHKIMRFQCKFCGKFFKRKHQVKEHERLHSDPVPCHVCGKMVRNLKTHVKNVHEVVRKPEQSCCVECGQMVNSYNMQLHIDRIHRKLPIPGKLYPCIQCSETFNRANDLRRHKYTAHSEKPLKPCPVEGCNAIFDRTKALNNHIRNCHRGRQIPCQHCDKSFNSESGIRKHMINKHNIIQNCYYK